MAEHVRSALEVDAAGLAYWLCTCGDYEVGYASKRAAKRGWQDHSNGLPSDPQRSAARRAERTAGGRQWGIEEAKARHADAGRIARRAAQRDASRAGGAQSRPVA